MLVQDPEVHTFCLEELLQNYAGKLVAAEEEDIKRSSSMERRRVLVTSME